MTKNIPEKKARQGGWGRHGFTILLSALVLASIAWGIAEFYGEQIKSPSTGQSSLPTPPSSPNPASTDPVQSKTDNVNGEPVDQNPKTDKNPTPQTSTGGDQQGTQPAQPASPWPDACGTNRASISPYSLGYTIAMLLADKGYDANALRTAIIEQKAWANPAQGQPQGPNLPQSLAL